MTTRLLECVYCWRLTSELEARLRKFNEGKCACGGALYPPQSKQLADAKQQAGTSEKPRRQ
jgi:hypothetical protein